MRKPKWLNKKIDINKCREVSALMGDLKLNTICKEALCPNISECFNRKVATFLILGDICTRGCRFCGVKTGKPLQLDLEENARVVDAVKRLGLKYVVVTSVTRDDIDDGGAERFVDIITQIRVKSPDTKVEVLVPDFQGQEKDIREVVQATPEVFAHNIETVKELYCEARQEADYRRSLDVLRIAKKIDSSQKTKTGLMLGLGEKNEQVLRTLEDIVKTGCEFLSIGQYLPPSNTHYKVQEYVAPAVFEYYKKRALDMGFKHVESAPYVRSSYMADRYLG